MTRAENVQALRRSRRGPAKRRLHRGPRLQHPTLEAILLLLGATEAPTDIVRPSMTQASFKLQRSRHGWQPYAAKRG